MPAAPYRPRPLQWQVFRGTDAVRDGLLTVDQLRSTGWRRIQHDVYADSRLDHDHRLACQATALWLPPGAAIAGPSAAYLYGVEHAAGFADEVHLLTAPERRITTRTGTRVHRATVDSQEVEAVDGIVRTSPSRTAWDLACWLDPGACRLHP